MIDNSRNLGGNLLQLSVKSQVAPVIENYANRPNL